MGHAVCPKKWKYQINDIISIIADRKSNSAEKCLKSVCNIVIGCFSRIKETKVVSSHVKFLFLTWK